jgi:modulator of FtsH protease HflC
MNRLLLLFVAVLVSSSLTGCAIYTLDETEQAVITRFGQPKGDPIIEPGLHFKLPFADRVNRFEKRWLEWSGEPNQIPTRDKKYIWVDTFARWRIADPLRFFQRMRDERTAQSRLDDIIDGETRNAIASFPLIEPVRQSNREFEDEEADGFGARTDEVQVGRERITRVILERASAVVSEFGIELVDVQIKRINYVDEVQIKVFERMISERKRIAERSRSEGMGRSAEIRGQKERELKSITSEAYRRSEEIRGKADAEAARIYAQAFGQDPEFYSFVRTLEAYRTTVDASTSLFLGTDADFMRYMRSADRKR